MSGEQRDRCVLLVEDSPGDADLIRELLGRATTTRTHLDHVTTVAAALASLRSASLDALLLDLHLPDSSGIETLLAVRAVAPDVAIVVLTGMEDELLALECIERGAQDYLAKSELRESTLQRALGHARARVHEVLERRRADALQARLAAIVEASGEAIISTALDATITSWNRGAELTFGYTKDEAIGRPFDEIVRAPDAAAAEEQARRLGDAVRFDRPVGGEALRLHRDGRLLTVAFSAYNLHDASGNIVGLAMNGRDVTEVRKRSEELQRRNEELQARDRQMRALATRLNAVREEERTRISREVHDELGQRLTGLKMDLRWIARRLAPKGRPDDAPIVAKLGDAERLVDETVHIVQRIALEMRPSALDALGLPAAIRDEARRFEERSGIHTELHLAPIQPTREVATEVFRILQELLTNVARHAKASAVQISLEETEHEWRLRVADDGIGVSSEADQRLASIGARGGEERRTQSLGLIGMRERAQSLRGTFKVGPNGERGTRAVVSVPRPTTDPH